MRANCAHGGKLSSSGLYVAIHLKVGLGRKCSLDWNHASEGKVWNIYAGNSVQHGHDLSGYMIPNQGDMFSEISQIVHTECGFVLRGISPMFIPNIPGAGASTFSARRGKRLAGQRQIRTNKVRCTCLNSVGEFTRAWLATWSL